MKALTLSTAALFLLLLISCGKDFDLQPDPIPAQHFVPIPDPSSDHCKSPTCEEVCQMFITQYQGLANMTCNTIWNDVTCCVDGNETYVLIYVAPTASWCGLMEAFENAKAWFSKALRMPAFNTNIFNQK